VDVDEASIRGVIVMNTPGANTIATAEHTMALLLAMCRNVARHTAASRRPLGPQKVYGRSALPQTIGIIGLGELARGWPHTARDLGCRL